MSMVAPSTEEADCPQSFRASEGKMIRMSSSVGSLRAISVCTHRPNSRLTVP